MTTIPTAAVALQKVFDNQNVRHRADVDYLRAKFNVDLGEAIYPWTTLNCDHRMDSAIKEFIGELRFQGYTVEDSDTFNHGALGYHYIAIKWSNPKPTNK